MSVLDNLQDERIEKIDNKILANMAIPEYGSGYNIFDVANELIVGNARKSATFCYISSIAGAPDSSNGTAIAYALDIQWITLVCFTRFNGVYIANKRGGTWSGWVNLTNYLPKTGGAITGDLCAKRFVYGEGQGNGVGINGSSYALAPFLSEAQFRLDNTTRAGYGFHNAGVNASFLYLDIASNRYMCVDNTGHVDKIMTSANFTISNGKLTINLD